MELSGDGHDVHTTDSGFGLIGRIDFLAPEPVILDIRLVDFDGLELLREVRERHPDLPVILCSAYDSYRHDARAVAADHYVVKSFDMRELKSKIQRSLEAVIPMSVSSRLEPRRRNERCEVKVQGRSFPGRQFSRKAQPGILRSGAGRAEDLPAENRDNSRAKNHQPKGGTDVFVPFTGFVTGHGCGYGWGSHLSFNGRLRLADAGHRRGSVAVYTGRRDSTHQDSSAFQNARPPR